MKLSIADDVELEPSATLGEHGRGRQQVVEAFLPDEPTDCRALHDVGSSGRPDRDRVDRNGGPVHPYTVATTSEPSNLACHFVRHTVQSISITQACELLVTLGLGSQLQCVDVAASAADHHGRIDDLSCKRVHGY